VTKRKPDHRIRSADGRRHPLVLIEWEDSCSVPLWHAEEPANVPTRCRSVGWLLHDGKAAKTIAPHVADPDGPAMHRSGEMTIPTRAVIRVRRL
jgi:hypothetical protein